MTNTSRMLKEHVIAHLLCDPLPTLMLLNLFQGDTLSY